MVKRKDSAGQASSGQGYSGQASSGQASSGQGHPGAAPVDASGVVAAGQADLDLLRQGRIDVDEYVRRQAEGATQHLVGSVSAERLADLRELLAAQALQDPGLQDVVARLRDAAGKPV